MASYYFILQPKYNIPQVDVHQGDYAICSKMMKILIWKNKKMELTYFIMENIQKNYLKEEAESGVYDRYLIIKYNEK